MQSTLSGEGKEASPENVEEKLIEEGEIAGDYLEQLLDILDLDGDIDLDVMDGRAMVSISGSNDLVCLVGGSGEVLNALQELTRLVVQQITGERSRLLLDIAEYRVTRRVALTTRASDAARRVLESSAEEKFEPMSAFDRKTVHDAVAQFPGVISESEGVEPDRYVVVTKL